MLKEKLLCVGSALGYNSCRYYYYNWMDGVFLLQISRSIGDAYLKKAEFNREPLLAKFRLPAPFKKPILSPEPSTSTHKLSSTDQFLIFASDGLWEQLSNQDAVNIVHSYPRNVSCCISREQCMALMMTYDYMTYSGKVLGRKKKILHATYL